MNSEPPPLPPKKPLTPVVLLAFIPSIGALTLATNHIHKSQMATVCVVYAVVSIACCAVSSVTLFKRNTSAAIVFGILLGLLNLAIVAGFGCAAMLSGVSGR